MCKIDKSAPTSSIPDAAGGQTCLTHTVEGAEQLEQLNAAGRISVAFDIPAAQPVHLALHGSKGDALSVWSTQSHSGFISRPTVPIDLFTIRFITGGVMSRSVRMGRDTLVKFDQALFASFDEMRFEQASPNFSAITASISKDAIIDACAAMGVHPFETHSDADRILDLKTVQLFSLRRSLAHLRDQLAVRHGEADLMTPLLQELLIYQIVSAWPSDAERSDTRVPETTDRPVKLAIDYVEGNLSRKIEISDIAAASGLGVRGLQLAFKRRMGCTPVQFLIGRRLDKVHAALHAGIPFTIREIAGEWGFTHMSDFARRYRYRFGQNPRISRKQNGRL